MHSVSVGIVTHEIGRNRRVRVATSDGLIQLSALRAGVLRLGFRPLQHGRPPSETRRAASWSALSLLAAAIGLGLWQPAFFRELIDRIASL